MEKKLGIENFFKNIGSQLCKGLKEKEAEYADLNYQIYKCRKKIGETDKIKLIGNNFYYKNQLITDITITNGEKTCFYSRSFKLIKFNKKTRLYEQYYHNWFLNNGL